MVSLAALSPLPCAHFIYHSSSLVLFNRITREKMAEHQKTGAAVKYKKALIVCLVAMIMTVMAV